MHPEISRRLVHMSGSVIPVAYLLDIVEWNQLQLLLGAGIVLALSIEILRLFGGVELPLVSRMIRDYEEEHLAGYALYVIGGGIVGLVFVPAIAVPAMLMLTIADPISGLLSDDQLRRVKRPHVLVTTFAICVAIAWWSLPPSAAIAAAIAATLADGVKPVIKGYVIDDNLTIPLGAALAAAVVLEVTTIL